MGRKIKLYQNPYDEDSILFSKKSITLRSGVTILIGCNGIGKTTLIRNIKSELEKKEIPHIHFNNLQDRFGSALFYGGPSLLANFMSSSEGEGIISNLGHVAAHISRFVEENPNLEEFWILLDAVDSGLSIDNVVMLKEHLFDVIMSDERLKDTDVYIVASANSFELARDEQCLDVCNLKYCTCKTYERYKNLILKSSEENSRRSENSSAEEDE